MQLEADPGGADVELTRESLSTAEHEERNTTSAPSVSRDAFTTRAQHVSATRDVVHE